MDMEIILLLKEAAHWLVGQVSGWGYIGVIALMAIESSFIPFPSEIIMVPAGYLVAKGDFNMVAVIGSGLLGSLIGAFINYYLSISIGRAVLLRYGKYVGLAEHKLEKAEVFFQKHGVFSTLVGRLLPVIRQLISVPAGLSRMNIALFSLCTAIGAGIWCAILAYVGYLIGDNVELIEQILGQIIGWVLALAVVAIVVYTTIQLKKRRQ